MDSTCHIWDVMTGRVVNVIKLDIPIRCLAVSEGDQYLCLCTMSFAGEAVFRRNSSSLIAHSLHLRHFEGCGGDWRPQAHHQIRRVDDHKYLVSHLDSLKQTNYRMVNVHIEPHA